MYKKSNSHHLQTNSLKLCHMMHKNKKNYTTLLFAEDV